MAEEPRARDARTALIELIGELDAIERLSGEEADALYTAVQDADRRHADKMAAAADESLGHIPSLLRPGVRKVLGL